MAGRALTLFPLWVIACSQRADAPPAPVVTPEEDAPEGCVPGASAFVGEIPEEVVLQWAYVRHGAVQAWRVHSDGRFDWTYGRPVPLSPTSSGTWYDGPSLSPDAVASIRKAVANRLPHLVSLEREDASMHVAPHRGFDAPGVGSAWYSGGCEPADYFTFANEVDGILDADGRPRTRIREKGSSP